MNDGHWIDSVYDETYLNTYEPVLSAELTSDEVRSIVRALDLKSGQKVLDLACGHGRHSIELARQGFGPIVGLDFSRLYLGRARRNAALASVGADPARRLEFVQGDMRVLEFEEEFDAVFNYFTAMFYWDDETHLQILKGIRRSLKEGGRLLIETSNRERKVQAGALSREWVPGNEDGPWTLDETTLNLEQGRTHTKRFLIFPDGSVGEKSFHNRIYALSELISLLKAAGLTYQTAYGGIRLEPFSLSSPRMIVVASKESTV